MSALLDDELNLTILENICNGVGVEVNISGLARDLNKHRDTIRDQVQALFDHEIINKPVYPFIRLHQEHPLMVIVRADLPRTESISKFLIENEHIFGAYYLKDEEYNTFLIMFFKDISSYVDWRKKIVAEKEISPRDNRHPASGSYFSNNHIIKYEPYSPIFRMEERYQKGEKLMLNGYKMNNLNIQILKKLMMGGSIRTNENLLSKKLEINRKTVERRISSLLKERVIGMPVSRFPKFFVPSGHILVYCLLEIKKSMNNVIKAIKSDPCVPYVLEASLGRYNILLFQVFSSVDEHLDWENRYTHQFPGSLGAMKNIYLSPTMSANIDQQKTSLAIIRKRKEALYKIDI